MTFDVSDSRWQAGVEWRLTLPKNTSIPSLYLLSDNAVVYLDQATATIVKVTQQGQTVMHRMTADQAIRGVNILSVAGTVVAGH
jgi:hypothetical protein